MRILIINHEFPELGSEVGRASYFLLREYSKNPDLFIDYVTSSEDAQHHTLQMGEQIMIHRLPVRKKSSSGTFSRGEMRRFTRAAYKFSRALTKEREYDLTHAFFLFPSGVTCLLLEWRMKLPFVVSLQQSDTAISSGSLFKFLVGKAWKNAYFLIAGNPKLRETMESSFPKKEIKIFCSLGIDTDSFFPDAEKRRLDEFIILCDSELVPVKGARFIIQAFKILSGRYQQVRMVVIGEGAERQSLQNLARGLEIDAKINFLGDISSENSQEYYQEADVFVMPSLDQSVDNGIVIRRALAFGLPIVATPVSGVQELVTDGQNGFLVALSTADDLADKIDNLILDKNLRNAMGQSSLRLAQQLSWQSYAEHYLEVYSETKNLGHIRQ